ncbi:hypothetical protein [Thioalkalivibrio sp. ALE16]|uniref:hypothetical protein n=1 Tax=Thioalkalivibrio sp. ALE16 TaxID=1158172 RepID=UPI0003607023|nr:hypothetical protein [Thioalkalivibrio sp. ALE16]
MDAIQTIPLQPQRQDALSAQLEDLHRAAKRLGLCDAADALRSAFGTGEASTQKATTPLSDPDPCASIVA